MRNSDSPIAATLLILLSIALAHFPANSETRGFESSVNGQVRFDDRSGKPSRWQYRLRWYPKYTFDDTRWSINSFVSTGDDFSGSHNTVSSGDTDYLYFRRAFLRYQSKSLRTEFGVIPTYKGRVSSSGLSKNGFIRGFRGVISPNQNAQLELVVGSLNNTNAKRALELPDKADYFELELSVNTSKSSGYEVSIERMTSFNFLRTEYRFEPLQDTELYVEWIKRIDNLDDKFVLGFDSEFNLYETPFEMQGYYAYVSDGIGARAELTEDFISTGHGVSVEIKTPLYSSELLKMFMRFDGYRGNTRFITGVEIKI